MLESIIVELVLLDMAQVRKPDLSEQLKIRTIVMEGCLHGTDRKRWGLPELN